ncbi:MAG: hypothetical protein QOG53_2509 [Frankiales bacterium]|jgi:hypothetical protein|nr:hypothetical protein [Frankiales bacterium]
MVAPRQLPCLRVAWRPGGISQLVLVVGAAMAMALAGCSGGKASPKQAGSQSQPSEQVRSASPSSTLPARWWQWAESVPSESNPIDDATGRSCALNQPSDVWFLAGTHGGSATRRCTVPVGRRIYFPVLNQICTVTPGETSAAAIRACSATPDVARATLDGTPVHVATATSGSAFPFTARSDSSTGFSKGRHSVVAWGLWVGPLEISQGQHTLSFKGQAGTFTTSVTYHLTVR